MNGVFVEVPWFPRVVWLVVKVGEIRDSFSGSSEHVARGSASTRMVCVLTNGAQRTERLKAYLCEPIWTAVIGNCRNPYRHVVVGFLQP